MKQEEVTTVLDNIGKPVHFDFDKFLEVVDELVTADEVISALKMLDLAPSFYREKKKDVLNVVRDHIKYRISTPLDYCNHYLEKYDIASKYEKEMSEKRHEQFGGESKFEDLGDMIHESFCYPRGAIMIDLVKSLNEKNITPHIMELGPATYWLPHGLLKQGLKFKYKPLTLNAAALTGHAQVLKDILDFNMQLEGHNIFVCFEVIEHLWNDSDIVIDFLKPRVPFKQVCISTPLHTYAGGQKDPERDIQHLRCYSKEDFEQYALKNFPDRQWKHYLFDSQVLIGEST